MVLTAHGKDLKSIDVFNYLGIMLLHYDSDWPAVVPNICKAHKKWARISRKLVREGTRVLGKFFTVVVQSIILFGPET